MTTISEQPRGTVPPPDGHLETAIARALALELPAVVRLGYADVVVAFEIIDVPEQSFVLDLTTAPARLTDDRAAAEVTIQLSASQAVAFVAGRLPLTDALLTGAVASEGPVRTYLEVDPILRYLLQRVACSTTIETAPATPPARISGAPTPTAELLAIETRDLHKSFGRQTILDGLNLSIPEGMVSVVLGPSGTGKSVLLQHIIGLMRPDSGDVIVRGRSLGAMSKSELLDMRPDIGVMFQDGALFSAMNVYDNVAFPLRQHTDLTEPEIEEIVMDRLEAVGLAASRDNLPPQLSGGMRKRAGLARALVLDPKIVLCDEPDSGLDPVRTALLADLLAEEHAETGGTMLVVTHNIALAKRVAEHMSVLWQGRVVQSGTTESVLASENQFVQQFLAGASAGPLSMDA
ncbi:MAG: transporter related protein [Solirubrobacterales bacterium]|nr:transporter related protein [Solirubrobacterales bacterium]